MNTRNQTLTAAICFLAFAFLCGAAMSQTYTFPDTIQGRTIAWSHTNPTGESILFRLYRDGAVVYSVRDVFEQYVPKADLAGTWTGTAANGVGESAHSTPAVVVSLYPIDEPPPVTGGFPWLAETAELLTGGYWCGGNVTSKYSAGYGGGLLFWGAASDPACWGISRSASSDGVITVRIHARMPHDPTSLLHFSVNEEEKSVQVNGTAWRWYDFGSYAVDAGANIMQFRAYGAANFLVDSLDVRVGGLSVPLAPVLLVK